MRAMRIGFHVAVVGLALGFVSHAAAQDVRGLEICTAEKNMERRTGCLQANIDFLQQRLNRMAQEAQQKQAAADREMAAVKAQLAAANGEIAVLKEAVAKMVKAGDAQKSAVDRK
jgi:hypothetical protein